MTLEPGKDTSKEETAQGEEKTSEGQDATNQKQQEEWQRAYLQQQRRMRCPGCGEGDEVF